MLTLEKSMSALGKYVCLRWGSMYVGVSICPGSYVGVNFFCLVLVSFSAAFIIKYVHPETNGI